MLQTLEYGPGGLPAAEIQRSVDEFWAEYERDPVLREETARVNAGISSVDLAGRAALVRVRPRGSGFDAATVGLIVAFAPAGNAIAISVWKDVLLPWIKRQRGEDAVGSEEPRKP